MSKGNSFWLMLVLIIAACSLSMLVAPINAANDPLGTRSMLTSVSLGQTFDVTVTFVAPANDFNAVVFSDFAPNGWTVSTDSILCIPAAFDDLAVGNRADYIWAGPYTQGTAFRAVYRVTTPSGSAGTYGFTNGTVEYYLGGTGPTITNIGGNSNVTILSQVTSSALTPIPSTSPVAVPSPANENPQATLLPPVTTPPVVVPIPTNEKPAIPKIVTLTSTATPGLTNVLQATPIISPTGGNGIDLITIIASVVGVVVFVGIIAYYLVRKRYY